LQVDTEVSEERTLYIFRVTESRLGRCGTDEEKNWAARDVVNENQIFRNWTVSCLCRLCTVGWDDSDEWL